MKRSYFYDPAKPPSGAVPRFPIWEIVVTVFLVYYGILGLVRSTVGETNDSDLRVLIGDYIILWSLALLISGIFSLVGLATPAPNGFVIHLIGMTILATAATSILVGLVVLQGVLFFPGSTALYLFSLGGLARSIQLMLQLRRLKQGVETMVAPAELIKEFGKARKKSNE